MLYGTTYTILTIYLLIGLFTLLKGTILNSVVTFKYLSLWLDFELSFGPHLLNEFIKTRINISLKIMYVSINCFTFTITKHIVQQLLFPVIDYGDIIYQNTTETRLHSLDVVYNSICRFVLSCPYRTHHCVMYDTLKIEDPPFYPCF